MLVSSISARPAIVLCWHFVVPYVCNRPTSAVFLHTGFNFAQRCYNKLNISMDRDHISCRLPLSRARSLARSGFHAFRFPLFYLAPFFLCYIFVDYNSVQRWNHWQTHSRAFDSDTSGRSGLFIKLCIFGNTFCAKWFHQKLSKPQCIWKNIWRFLLWLFWIEPLECGKSW